MIKNSLISWDYSDSHVSLACGDACELMQKIDPVDLILTSPPYDNLRDYSGHPFRFEPLAEGIFNVLKDGAVLVWIVGDETIEGSESGTSFKQALFFKALGLNLHDTMIYEKDPRYPEKSRYLNCFEYMFVFSKGEPKTFHPIKDLKNTHYPIKRKRGTDRQKDGSLLNSHRVFEISEFSNRHNIWHYPTGLYHSSEEIDALQHPAIFPEELANDHILSWSDPGDTVLDPMCGSGTVLKMAKYNDRKAIGFEIHQPYLHIAKQRCLQENFKFT